MARQCRGALKYNEMNRIDFGFVKAIVRSVSPMVAVLVVVACGKIGVEEGEGELRLSFAGGETHLTRAVEAIPDTSDFLLSIKNSKGEIVYDGKYGACPESLPVQAGSYEIEVISEEFTIPAFSAPQFGDRQCVVVPSGGVADVRLLCSQLNSGVKLNIDSGFLEAYPEGVIFLKAPAGKLMYGYREKRVAYFPSGSVSLVLNDSGKDDVLMTRNLLPQEMLVLNVSVAASQQGSASSGSSKSSGLSISVDTTRYWMTEEYVIGSSSAGTASDHALTVSQALSSIGQEDVWISGYIVGGDLTSAAASFEEPFKSRTNIVLGPRSTTSTRSSCLSVQLPAGDLRDDLNLVDNPDLLGTKVCLKGDIVEAYFGMPGIKNVSEYMLQ